MSELLLELLRCAKDVVELAIATMVAENVKCPNFICHGN